jgi:hypothetical protein
VTQSIESIKAQHPLHHVAARYIPSLKLKGDKYWGLCPFHQDTHPTNFNIYRGRDSEYRFRCFACGEHGDVIDFVAKINNLSVKEALTLLDTGELPDVGSHIPRDLPPDESSVWVPIVPAPEYAPVYNPEYTYNPASGSMKNYKYGLTRCDPYLGEDGRVLCWVVRLEYEDGHKACPTITYCEGPEGRKLWAAKRMPKPYPLHGLDQLAQHKKKHVILVSGEKTKAAIDEFLPDVFVVVSWLGGDDAIKHVDLTPLKGRKVTYWPDADNSGRRAMNYAYKAIEKDGTG